MKRVQVTYLIAETVCHDVVAAENVNVRMFRGGHAYVKTGGQSVFYATAYRIVIDHHIDGEPQDLVRGDVTDR